MNEVQLHWDARCWDNVMTFTWTKMFHTYCFPMEGLTKADTQGWTWRSSRLIPQKSLSALICISSRTKPVLNQPLTADSTGRHEWLSPPPPNRVRLILCKCSKFESSQTPPPPTDSAALPNSGSFSEPQHLNQWNKRRLMHTVMHVVPRYRETCERYESLTPCTRNRWTVSGRWNNTREHTRWCMWTPDSGRHTTDLHPSSRDRRYGAQGRGGRDRAHCAMRENIRADACGPEIWGDVRRTSIPHLWQ